MQTTSREALRTAIKLAVDEEDHELAAALLEVAKRFTKPTAKDADVVSLLDRAKR
jgi:hypothetical protein